VVISCIFVGFVDLISISEFGIISLMRRLGSSLALCAKSRTPSATTSTGFARFPPDHDFHRIISVDAGDPIRRPPMEG
jgi:hypothetical protein